MDTYTYPSTIGNLTITSNAEAITEIKYNVSNPSNTKETPLIKQAFKEISEYLNQTRTDFTVPINLQGTPFQMKVWQALKDIPYGETKTYKEIATQIGNDKASRAIGMACNRNPFPVIIPCHRVLGTNGTLTGYAGGIEVKERLLNLESKP